MNKVVKRIICFSVMAVVVIALAVGNVFAFIYANPITAFLAGTGDTGASEETLQAGDDLCRQLGEEGAVLLKNQTDADKEPALPLEEDENKVNLFGFSAYDPSSAADFDGFLMKGIGSGSSTIADDKMVTLQDALTENDIEYNPALEAIYDAYDVGRYFSGNSDHNAYWLDEPEITDEQFAAAHDYSDIAVVVFSRLGGENIGEQPKTQNKGSVNADKTYLEITDAEQALLDEVTERFGKVIVLLNTSNTMHCGFLEDENVDAAMYIGLTGQSGAFGVVEALKGVRTVKDEDGQETEEKFSPSGKVTDTYTYVPAADPSFVNAESSSAGGTVGTNIQYAEDIYFGYKWYETADAEGFWNSTYAETTFGIRNGYKDVVQFPFGFGLSYTTFDWEVVSVTAGEADADFTSGQITDANKNEEITVTVKVTNTGDYPGQDVVQLYYTPQYNKGEIEKSAVNLLDFAKTGLLPAGGEEQVTLSFTPYDMASFDAYDDNDNQKYAYELDAGTYTISLRTDAHTVKVNQSGAVEHAEISYELPADVIYAEDPVTGTAVETRFTGAGAYAGVPVDGSTVGMDQNYLSRANFSGSFPSDKAGLPTDGAKIDSAAKYYQPVVDENGGKVVQMPATGIEAGMRLTQIAIERGTDDDGNPKYAYADATLAQLRGEESLEEGQFFAFDEELMEDLADYDSPDWDYLLDQMTVGELTILVECGGFRTEAIESIGKPYFNDYDGPAGFNTNSRTGDFGGSVDAAMWTAYPSESLIGCTWDKELLYTMGELMGQEAQDSNLNGWYAPGVNLHRTNYTSRNYEYYSEDGVLSGKLAAPLIKGARDNGLYCYIKHFACSESGPNARNWNTWLTEQNLRENYLKPFEIAVKEGDANAVMSAFNRIGATWAGANYALLTEILREEWGFEGSVITDWTSGDSEGGMYTRQGIRAGNDLWLNPNDSIGGPLNKNNAEDIYCARKAAHNILYTLVDTWNASRFSAQVKEAVFPWWIPVLITFDVLVVAGFGVWTFFLLKPKKAAPAASGEQTA